MHIRKVTQITHHSYASCGNKEKKYLYGKKFGITSSQHLLEWPWKCTPHMKQIKYAKVTEQRFSKSFNKIAHRISYERGMGGEWQQSINFCTFKKVN